MFKIQYGDITKIKCDVIVNSVGVDTTNYGGICASVLKAANSPELKNLIDNLNDVYTVGEYFITEGYGLECKNIIHLITPHYDNDPNYTQFRECIKRILNECQKNGFKDICIPSIGTGANKYDKKEVRTIIAELSEAYCNCYPRAKMNIRLILPENAISEANDARLSKHINADGDYHDKETIKKFKTGSKNFDNTIKPEKLSSYSKIFFAYDKFIKGGDDVVVRTKGFTCINDYVEAYIEGSLGKSLFYEDPLFAKKRIHLFFAYGKKSKKNATHVGSDAYGEIKRLTFTNKKVFYKLAFALKMSVSEAETFFKFFGYGFAHPGINKTDDLVKDLLGKRIYGIVEIEYAFKKNKIDQTIF